MAKGQFTQAQNTHIQSFFPEFVKEMEKGVMGHALTRWKQTKASVILDSSLFTALDTKFSRKIWFEVCTIIPPQSAPAAESPLPLDDREEVHELS